MTAVPNGNAPAPPPQMQPQPVPTNWAFGQVPTPAGSLVFLRLDTPVFPQGAYFFFAPQDMKAFADAGLVAAAQARTGLALPPGSLS
jgi:hypothetical protein